MRNFVRKKNSTLQYFRSFRKIYFREKMQKILHFFYARNAKKCESKMISLFRWKPPINDFADFSKIANVDIIFREKLYR